MMVRKEARKMIMTLRIDERLIHGQVIATWLRSLSISHIIVANDAAAKDEVLQKTLKMVLPPEQKCLMKGVEDAVRILCDPRCGDMRILLVAANPVDAYTLVRSVKGIPEVNLANYGSITKAKVQGKVTVSGMVYLDSEDIEATNALIGTGIPVFTQKTPSDPKKKLTHIS
jgi:PTS system mannose-specific IIB component